MYNYARIAGDSFTPPWSASANEMTINPDSSYQYSLTLPFLNTQSVQYKFIKATPTAVTWEESFPTTSLNRELVIVDQGNGKMIVKHRWRKANDITTVNITTVPSAPTNLAAIAGNKQVALTWTALTDIDVLGYNLYRNTAKIAVFASRTINSFTDTDVVNNTQQYTYYLKSYNAAGVEGAASNSVNATPVSLFKNGHITTNTVWDLSHSPYIVDGDIIIDAGIQLTIDTGVSVKFNTTDNANLGSQPTKIEFIVSNNAKLKLNGLVSFVSNSGTPSRSDWYGIVLQNSND